MKETKKVSAHSIEQTQSQTYSNILALARKYNNKENSFLLERIFSLAVFVLGILCIVALLEGWVIR